MPRQLEGYAVAPGPSIIELIEREADLTYGSLSTLTGNDYERARGKCEGLALALAIVHNPYEPNVKAQRAAIRARAEA